MVLAHGWTEQLRFWGPVIRLLRDRGLRVVAYDLRGHGESGAAPMRDYSIERFGEDLEAVLAAAVRRRTRGDARRTLARRDGDRRLGQRSRRRGPGTAPRC